MSIYFSGTKDNLHDTPVFDENFNISAIFLPAHNKSTFLGLCCLFC